MSSLPLVRADVEMHRVLRTAPIESAVVGGVHEVRIEHWRHEPLHDVVEPMSDHVLMTFFGPMQRFQRRSGRTVVNGTARQGCFTLIPSGSSSRWDIHGPLDVVQLYLPPALLNDLADRAGHHGTVELIERTSQPDATAVQLLTMGAKSLPEASDIDKLFREQLMSLIGVHLLKSYCGASQAAQRAVGGLSPLVLRRVQQRLRDDMSLNLSLAGLAAEAGLSEFHFCRAFKQSTGLPPHAWLRQCRMEQAQAMLRDHGASMVQIAEALGYATQTAFGAAFKRFTGLTPSDWRLGAY